MNTPSRIPFFWVKRWGIKIGHLQVNWLDLWADAWGFQVCWKERSLIERGFQPSGEKKPQ